MQNFSNAFKVIAISAVSLISTSNSYAINSIVYGTDDRLEFHEAPDLHFLTPRRCEKAEL